MRHFVPALILALALVPAAAGGDNPSATVGAASSGTVDPNTGGLKIAASPSSGRLPLRVTFSLDAPKAVSWRLDFGDGRSKSATGEPPSTLSHIYTTKGSFVAHLSTTYPVVTTRLPAPAADAPAPAAVPVDPASLAGPLVTLGFAQTAAASRPHTVQFTLASMFTGNVTSWQLVFGDGKQASGQGAPPASVAHSYARAGTFRAYVVLSEATASRYTRLQVPAKGLSVGVR